MGDELCPTNKIAKRQYLDTFLIQNLACGKKNAFAQQEFQALYDTCMCNTSLNYWTAQVPRQRNS